jgi:hypothetical protein
VAPPDLRDSARADPDQGIFSGYIKIARFATARSTPQEAVAARRLTNFFEIADLPA